MKTKPFQALNWITPKQGNLSSLEEIVNSSPTELPSSMGLPFSPSNYLIPDWKGEAIISKHGLKLKKIINELWVDAKIRFDQIDFRNKSISNYVYDEFLNYCEHRSLHLDKIVSPQILKEHLVNPDSPFYSQLSSFKDIYTFRSVVTYLLKARFITALATEVEKEVSLVFLTNPSSYLNKIFQKGGQFEFQSEALQTNPYSWYRPTKNFYHFVKDLPVIFENLSLTELTKIITFSNTDKLSFNDNDYVHSLSHKSFGYFLNLLNVWFPQWLDDSIQDLPPNISTPKALSCKFMGDHLTSLGLSYSLDQEEKIHQSWRHVVTTDIIGDSFYPGIFFKICHELQNLTLIVKVGKKQRHDPIYLITKIMNEKYSSSSSNTHHQMPLFQKVSDRSERSYDRITLNLLDLPNKNSYPYMISQIAAQEHELSDSGHIYVFTNQKLFVPSQNHRLASLLSKFKLQSQIDFSDLKGKGKVPNFLYIFSKRDHFISRNSSVDFDQISKKDSCFNFRFSGELNSFAQFEIIVKEFHHFLNNRQIYKTPIYQKHLDKDLEFYFHQDAIIEGRLLSSHKKKNNQITHPSFFKNLTKRCIPLKRFYNFQLIEDNSENFQTSNEGILGLRMGMGQNYPLVMVIKYENPEFIELEIVRFEALKAVKERYGNAYTFYLGFKPKERGVSINTLREYFNNNIGRQIIQMTFQTESLTKTKVKASLESLLVPEIIFQKANLTQNLNEVFDLSSKKVEELLAYHPDSILLNYNNSYPILNSLSQNYPAQVIEHLSQFKSTMEILVEKFNIKGHSINYSNPLVLNVLNEPQALCSLYPNNQEVYLDFHVSSATELNTPLISSKIKKTEDNNYLLVLSNQDKEIVSLYSDETLLLFIRYILNSAQYSPISDILLGLQVPTIQKMKLAIENYSSMKDCSHQILQEVQKFINSIIQQHISE